MRSPRLIPVLLALLVLCPLARAEPTRPQPQSRCHAVLFDPPPGWSRKDQPDGDVLLIPGDLALFQTVVIRIGTPTPPRESLDAQLDADLAGQQADGMTVATWTTDAARRKHPDGFDLVTREAVLAENENAADYAVVFTHLDAGNGEVGSQPIYLIANNEQLRDKYRPAYEALIDGVVLMPRVAYADAPAGSNEPPLTLYTTQRLTDFFEWAMDVPFTQQQRDVVRDTLVNVWKGGNLTEIAAVRQLLAFRSELDKLTPEQRDVVRQKSTAQFVQALRAGAANGEPFAKMMVGLYDSARTPIAQGAAGDPPLTRQAADAALEATYFMASMAADPTGPVVRPTPEQFDAWATELAAQYASMPADRKTELADAAGRWGMLRLGWSAATPDQRADLARTWSTAPQVAALLDHVRQSQKTGDRLDVDSKTLGDKLRALDTHQTLFQMGALRMNHAYFYR